MAGNVPADLPIASGPSCDTRFEEFAFGPFRMDVASRRLFRDAELVPLTARVFDTLLLLVRNRGLLVPKEELIRQVWPGAFVSEDSLTQNISVLRRTLGDDASQPRYIATVARRGYRFVAEVHEIAASVEQRQPHEAPAQRGGEPVAGQRRLDHRHQAIVWGTLLAVAGALVVALLGGRALAPSVPAPTRIQFSLQPPPGTTLVSSGVLSPNGRHLAFVAQEDGRSIRRLWVHDIESGETRVIARTEGVWRAFWAPDSSALGFFANNRIKRVGLTADDPPRVISTTTSSRPPGGSWSARGFIVYAEFGSLYSVPASGGQPTLLKRLNPSGEEVSLTWPVMLPDGEHLLYSVRSALTDRTGIYFGSLTSRDDTRLLPEWGEQRATYDSGSGHLLFVRNQVVMAQRFNPAFGHLQGDAFPVVGTMVRRDSVSASTGGLVAFGGGNPEVRMSWLDRAGSEHVRLPGLGPLTNFVLSPDERQVLADSNAENNSGAWLVDLDRNVPTRVAEEVARQPHFSPDGTRLAFTVQRGHTRGLFIRPVHSADGEELALQSDERKFVSDWSDDDRYIVFVSWSETTKQDLWVLPTFGDRRPWPYLGTKANEVQAQISPDGRWIAYASDESGTLEVYVDSFPKAGARLAISNGGGGQPQWRRDGRELFYLNPEGVLMSLEVRPGNRLHVGVSKPLFRLNLAGSLMDDRNVYVSTRDGQRFLVSSLDHADKGESLTVVANWTSPPRTSARVERLSSPISSR